MNLMRLGKSIRNGGMKTTININGREAKVNGQLYLKQMKLLLK